MVWSLAAKSSYGDGGKRKAASPYPCCHSLRMGMNDTIKAKKYLYSYGNITIEEYVGQAILGYANLMLKN